MYEKSHQRSRVSIQLTIKKKETKATPLPLEKKITSQVHINELTFSDRILRHLYFSHCTLIVATLPQQKNIQISSMQTHYQESSEKTPHRCTNLPDDKRKTCMRDRIQFTGEAKSYFNLFSYWPVPLWPIQGQSYFRAGPLRPRLVQARPVHNLVRVCVKAMLHMSVESRKAGILVFRF